MSDDEPAIINPTEFHSQRHGYTRTIVEDERPVTAAQLSDISEILLRRVEGICLSREREIEEAVAAGVARAMDAALSDQHRIQKFWRTGFDELSSHASNGASQWVGKRILTALIAAIATVSLVWLVRNGGLK
jgi:hypothetical protein